MKMPFLDSAVVSLDKVTDYLLSSTHPRGSMKAVWFVSLGFTDTKPDELVQALLEHARNTDVENTEETKYGTKYRLVGKFSGPNGSSRNLCSIWIVLHETEAPRFVTAYPDK